MRMSYIKTVQFICLFAVHLNILGEDRTSVVNSSNLAVSLLTQQDMTDMKVQHGDVLMRSLRVWPKDEKDTRDTLKTAKEFDVNKIVWIYENTAEFNAKVHAEGMGIGTSMADNARESWYSEMSPAERKEFVERYTIRNLNGEQVVPKHFLHFNDPYISHFVPDVLVPGWIDLYAEYVEGLYRTGIDTLHRDDPLSNWVAPRCGGTFTDASVEYFRRYLEKNYTPDQLTVFGVDNISTFNVRDYFNALGAPTGYDLWKWRGSPLMSVYTEAMQQATTDFYAEVRRRVETATGRKIPWSLNGAGPVNPVDQVFDFRIGEYQSHMNQPQTLLVMSRYAANAGKMQALISMVDGNWDQHPEQFVFETRKHIATAYASGMLPLVPWCMYMHQAPRYYGSIEDFGDLYQFVSNYRELFDGYALVAASGVDTQSNLYQWMPNKEIVWPRASGRSLFSIGRENVFALLRSNGTSRVIHVVDWNANPASFDLSFNPQEVIGTEVADLTVLRPGQDLLKISGYAGGSVEIPALSPWGLIQVAPAKSVSSMVVAPKVVEPSRCVVAEGTVVDIQVPSDCTGWVRCPGKQEFVEFDAKRRPILVNSGFLEIFSRRTVDGAESRHLRVSVQVYMSFMADFPVGGSGMDITDRFTCTKGLMKVNESFVGDSLRLGGVPVQGISAQGESMLSCGIDPAWKFFTVHAGIDDAEDRRPCLRFQVWLDDRLAYESSIVNPSKGVIADEDRDVFDIAVRIPEEAKTLRLVAAKSGFFADQNNIVWSSPTAYSDEGK